MTELEKIQYTKNFLDQLAQGVNPVDGTPVPEGDVARQARVVGCFRYVSGLLEGMIGRRIPHWSKEPFSAAPEQLMRYRFPADPITVSRFVQAVNDTVDLRRVRSLTVRDVTDWLTETGLLKQEESASGGKYRIPTDKGQEIGIASAEKNGRNGRYFSVTYNVAAQTYLLDHMAEVAAYAEKKWRERQEAGQTEPTAENE